MCQFSLLKNHQPGLALHALRSALAEKLKMTKDEAEATRFVVINAGEGGENFLHKVCRFLFSVHWDLHQMSLPGEG